MRVIHKYPIPLSGHFELELPSGAQFLTVQRQVDDPQMWWVVDPKAPKTGRTFRIFYTGAPLPDDVDLQYLGTFQKSDGVFVFFHLFEDVSL